MRNNLRTLVYAALLTAMAIVIPISFGFLKIQIPPFTATIASHVPMFLAMTISPAAAAFVGVGSALGFLMTSPAVVAARAFMHVFVGLSGAILLRNNISFTKMILITAPIHGVLEAIAVIPFGFAWFNILVVVGVGTVLHHFVDGAISYGLVKALSKTRNYGS
jgi:niacin transporter